MGRGAKTPIRRSARAVSGTTSPESRARKGVSRASQASALALEWGRNSVGALAADVLAQNAARLNREIRDAESLTEEEVHEIRRALRSSRASLRLFQPWLEPHKRGALNDEFRTLARSLGRVRDFDIAEVLFREAFRDDPALGDGLKLLADARGSAVEAARTTLAGPGLKKALSALAADAVPAWTKSGAAKGNSAEAVTDRVRRLWKRLRRQIPVALKVDRDAAYHEVRKRAKDLRAAIDIALDRKLVVASALRSWRRLRDGLSSLLKVMGTRQDAIVVQGMLNEVFSPVVNNDTLSDWRSALDRKAARADRRFRKLWRERLKALDLPKSRD